MKNKNKENKAFINNDIRNVNKSIYYMNDQFLAFRLACIQLSKKKSQNVRLYAPAHDIGGQ